MYYREVVLIVTEEDSGNTRSPTNVEPTSGAAAPTTSQADTSVPSTGQTGTSGLSRRPRQTRYRSK